VKRLRAIGCDLKPPGYESEDSPTANVRMVRWGGAGTDNGSLLLSVLATRAAPKFSGEEADWEAFAQDWATYRDILVEAEGGEIADVFLFEVLKGCVDPATQTVLKALRQKTPDLTFERAWQHLERTNAYDPVGARRKEWERVALKGGELTLATWRNYQSSFELTWARAEGISEREAEDKILRDLPFEWRERLTKECARKAQDNFWARAVKPIPFPMDEFQGILEAASGVRRLEIEDRQLEILIKCPNETAQEKVLELNGWDCPGGTLKMRWATRRLTVAEMCRWVERGLRVENELRPAKNSPRRVSAVRDDSPGARPEPRPQSKGKSEDRGRKGSKGPRKGASRAVTPGRETWSPRNQPAAIRQGQDYQGQRRTF